MTRVKTEVQLTYPASHQDGWVGDDILGLYLHDARQKGRIDKEELNLLSKTVHYGKEAQARLDSNPVASVRETEMLKFASSAGVIARNRIVDTNTGLVHMWANRHQGRGLPLEDLIQIGNMGLIHAAEKYDPDLGFAFSTYATRWIRAYIEKAVHQYGRTISIPVEESQSLQKLNRLILEHRTQTGDEPTIKDLAEVAGYSEEKVEKLLSMEISVGKLEREEEGETVSILDFLPPERHMLSMEEEIINRINEQSIQKAVHKLLENSSLSDIMLQIIRMKFGIGYECSMADTKISEIVGCSRKTVGQYFRAAMTLLAFEAVDTNLSGLID